MPAQLSSEQCRDFCGHTLLVGGKNIGKSTVCEALDLILGPERIFRRPVVDEHDFHCGQYLDGNGAAIEIRIETILIELSEEATRRFGAHLRRWDDRANIFIDDTEDALDHADGPAAIWALPLAFVGRYDRDEDDFVGNTFFDHPTKEFDALDQETEIKLGQGGRVPFTRLRKRLCGFVFCERLGGTFRTSVLTGVSCYYKFPWLDVPQPGHYCLLAKRPAGALAP